MTYAEYVTMVREALNDGRVTDMSLSEYVDALEEIGTDVEMMLDAARHDLEAEER